MAKRHRPFDVERTITLVTALAALLTAVYTYQLVRETRFAMGIGTLQNLEREFDEKNMRIARRDAATALLQQAASPGLDHVIDFFETIALLVRRGALDREMVWHTFYYWVDGYGRAAANLIAAEQRDQPHEWEDFGWLQTQLDKVEREKSRGSESTAGDVRAFLVDETKVRVTD